MHHLQGHETLISLSFEPTFVHFHYHTSHLLVVCDLVNFPTTSPKLSEILKRTLLIGWFEVDVKT